MPVTNDSSRKHSAKQIAVTTEVRPVLPPAPIPAALSTKVVVLEVPKIAPIDVAVASANSALSILELKPLPLSSAFSSSSEKMPLRRPVPMKVPIVSNVSDILKAKIVMSTNGIREASANRDGSPCDVKIAPNVDGNTATASEKLTVSVVVVTPNGMPMSVVRMIAIRMPPLTFFNVRITARTSPIKKIQSTG